MHLTGKIEQLIKIKNLSPSQFADMIGIPRSSISHILSGRNKPSLDVVQKVLNAFPDISAESLLFEDRNLDIMPMPNASIPSSVPIPTAPSAAPVMGTLFDLEPSPSKSDVAFSPEPTPVQPILSAQEESLPESTPGNQNLGAKLVNGPRTRRSNTNNQTTRVETRPSHINEIAHQAPRLQKQIERVILIYTDGTFSESKAM